MSDLPDKTSSILFVCMGNICRSPTGENVMRKLLDDADLGNEVTVDSAGTIGYHTGNRPDSRMTQAGKRRGLAMTGRARQVTAEDLDTFDLVLAMDDANFHDLMALSTESNSHKVRTFCTYCTEHDETEVPDPYYGGPQGFEIVLDLVEDGCRQILKLIQAQRSEP